MNNDPLEGFERIAVSGSSNVPERIKISHFMDGESFEMCCV